jgi:hypothetical protein
MSISVEFTFVFRKKNGMFKNCALFMLCRNSVPDWERIQAVKQRSSKRRRSDRKKLEINGSGCHSTKSKIR